MGKNGIKPTRIPHLYQVNYPEEGQVGFLVKVHRALGKKDELFSFSKYPDERTCFMAAKKRARKLEILYPRLTRREYAQIRRSNFKNNEVGVRKLTQSIKGRQYEFWEASWSPRVGAVKKKRFSVHKYGDEEAHKLARQARAEGLLSMSPRKHEHRHHHNQSRRHDEGESGED